MNNRELLGSYFRQQAELLMPDLIINPDIVQNLMCPRPVLSIAAPKAATSNRPAAQPAAQSVKRQPAAATATSSPLKNRLSSMRPVEKLVATHVKKAQPPASTPGNTAASGSTPVTDRRAALKELYIAGCTRCHLSQTRTKFVFGSGNAEAHVMVIGEAPGQDEDEQGLPFVGAAGKLLTSMLAAIDLDRNTDIFITNVLKCRPPENRSPESSEIITCIPMLKRQIDIIHPKAILLLGRIAAHAVLDINDSVAKMRSRIFDYQGIPAMVIYHPAALLRNAEYKRPAWEDLQQFKKLLATSGVYGSLHKE